MPEEMEKAVGASVSVAGWFQAAAACLVVERGLGATLMGSQSPEMRTFKEDSIGIR